MPTERGILTIRRVSLAQGAVSMVKGKRGWRNHDDSLNVAILECYVDHHYRGDIPFSHPT